MTIGCRSFPTPHTAKRVFELTIDLLDEWEIPYGKVSAVVTDNGSNMVAAFKKFALSISQCDTDDEEDEIVPVESNDREEVNVHYEVTEYMEFETACQSLFAGRYTSVL